MLVEFEPHKSVVGADGGKTSEEQSIAVDMKNELMDQIF